MKLNAAVYAKIKNDLVETQKKRIDQLETELKGMQAINGANLDRIIALKAERDAVRDAALLEAHDEISKAIDGAGGSECIQGLRVASIIISDLRAIPPQPERESEPNTEDTHVV